MKTLLYCNFVFLSSILWAQSNVTGSVPLTLVDGGTDCNGLGRLVEIHADPSGLSGDGGAMAGINAFVLAIAADQPGVLTAAWSESSPIPFDSVVTDSMFVTTGISIAGWSTDPNAPNQSYHLATLLLTGNQGNVSVSLSAQSTLASRFVSVGNGPDTMSYSLPSALVVNIPMTYNLNVLTGISSWQMVAAQYDLAAPAGPVDVNDLVKLITCSP